MSDQVENEAIEQIPDFIVIEEPQEEEIVGEERFIDWVVAPFQALGKGIKKLKEMLGVKQARLYRFKIKLVSLKTCEIKVIKAEIWEETVGAHRIDKKFPELEGLTYTLGKDNYLKILPELAKKIKALGKENLPVLFGGDTAKAWYQIGQRQGFDGREAFKLKFLGAQAGNEGFSDWFGNSQPVSAEDILMPSDIARILKDTKVVRQKMGQVLFPIARKYGKLEICSDDEMEETIADRGPAVNGKHKITIAYCFPKPNALDPLLQEMNRAIPRIQLPKLWSIYLDPDSDDVAIDLYAHVGKEAGNESFLGFFKKWWEEDPISYWHIAPKKSFKTTLRDESVLYAGHDTMQNAIAEFTARANEVPFTIDPNSKDPIRVRDRSVLKAKLILQRYIFSPKDINVTKKNNDGSIEIRWKTTPELESNDDITVEEMISMCGRRTTNPDNRLYSDRQKAIAALTNCGSFPRADVVEPIAKEKFLCGYSFELELASFSHRPSNAQISEWNKTISAQHLKYHVTWYERAEQDDVVLCIAEIV